MNKFMIALAASLGLGTAATAPAQAGGSWSISAGVYTTAPTTYYAPAPLYTAPVRSYATVPTYTYNTAPTYYAPTPLYRAPALTYVPRYYNPVPSVSFSFGKTFGSRNHHRKSHQHHTRKVERDVHLSDYWNRVRAERRRADAKAELRADARADRKAERRAERRNARAENVMLTREERRRIRRENRGH